MEHFCACFPISEMVIITAPFYELMLGMLIAYYLSSSILLLTEKDLIHINMQGWEGRYQET